MQTIKRDLTADQVRELFNYDHETGLLYWKIKPRCWHQDSLAAGSKYNDGYITTCIKTKRYKNHRLIWLWVYGEWPNHEIDHINNIKDDNRIENLRDVTRGVNGENLRTAHYDSRSGILGASWKEKRQCYHVTIKSKGRHYFLGLFKDPEQARDAYVTAKRKLHEGNTL